ncbi:hypothetical protein N7520_004260 [Penicillium odoratum]|uniref:uncharacterized protein n=1 Tax=Penicillium odoratum TaxID=1167516 RepID=UPI002549A0A7|nr:uncharacterized protein N7520_004260 [Penicillium odoratum]KAJ5769701.1 hypothetical protein N7520_004260 [Penicillium odoratum]
MDYVTTLSQITLGDYCNKVYQYERCSRDWHFDASERNWHPMASPNLYLIHYRASRRCLDVASNGYSWESSYSSVCCYLPEK